MFKYNLKFLYVIIFFIVLASCGQKPDLKLIYNDLPEDEILDVDTSLIYSGFGISIHDIQNRVNSELGNTLYNETNYVDHGGVRMKIKIDRTGEIELSGSDNKLFYTIPVKVKGRILINEKIFGINVRAEPGFELNLTLKLASRFELYDDFKFGVFTNIENIEWPRKPVIQAGPIKIDLTDAIESVIVSNEKLLSSLISKTAKSELNLKTFIRKSASKIPKYNYIKTKDIDLWMKLSPISLIVESHPRIENDSIKLHAGLSTFLTIASYEGDSSFIETEELNLRAINKIPEEFTIEMKVDISYSDLDSLLIQQIEKKGLLNSLPEDLVFENLKTGQTKDKEIYLAADIGGKLKGTIFNSGKLQFDTISNSIYLDEMKSSFYSDNFIWSVLYKLFFPSLKSDIQNKIKWPLDPLLVKVQKSVERLFTKLSNKGDLDMELKNLKFRIRSFNLKKEEVEILIRIEGQSNLNYSI